MKPALTTFLRCTKTRVQPQNGLLIFLGKEPQMATRNKIMEIVKDFACESILLNGYTILKE